MRGRAHEQTSRYPLQRHGGLTAQARPDSNFLRVALSSPLQILHRPHPRSRSRRARLLSQRVSLLSGWVRLGSCRSCQVKVSDSGEMASIALFSAFASSLFNCGIQVDWSGLPASGTGTHLTLTLVPNRKRGQTGGWNWSCAHRALLPAQRSLAR